MKKYFFLIMLSSLLVSLSAQSLQLEDIQQMAKKVSEKPSETALKNAISNNDVKKLALERDHVGKVNHFISDQVKTKGITNQKSSGRCWMFTGLNVMRAKVIEKYNLNEFQFSHNYLFFYDQLEKANLFYNGMIETAFKPIDDREVEWLLKNPIGDGGQWTGVVDLVTKYGLVPSEAMPETYHSENTSMMRRLLARKLRKDGLELRELGKSKLSKEAVINIKNEKLADIYQILVFCLGEPPTEFSWQYKDEKGIIGSLKLYTPTTFYHDVLDMNFNDYIMIMNDPAKEYHKLYEIKYDRHMYEGGNWKYINLPIETIKEMAIASIKGNEGMYFSCDVGKQLEAEKGYLDLETYNYNELFDVDFEMTKEQRIQSFESGSTHGMALMGVNILEDGNTDKWLLENSWGKKGNNGFLTMTDDWFGEYMFRLVINKKYVSQDVLEILKQEAIILPPWDPMFLMDF